MSVSQDDFAHRLKTCIASMGWLGLVCLLVFLATATFGFMQFQTMGVISAAVAGGLCYVSAASALLVTVAFTNTPNAVVGSLASIFLRTAFPLFMTILLTQASKPLADSGLLGMVLVNYLIVLAVETVLAVRIVQSCSSTVVRQ